MLIVILGLLISGATILIGYGVYSEWQTRHNDDLQAPPLDLFPDDDLPLTPNLVRFFQTRLQQFQIAVETHPFKIYGIIETLFWLVCLIPLLNHLFVAREGWAANLTWTLVILPHEVGHFICSPFGTLLMFLGGSIWQVLFWLLIAVYGLLVRRYFSSALFCWMIVGHSFMDMAVYIRDARSRNLPLLFGMDSSHHDWWNILRRLGLLEYDHAIADFAVLLGVLVIVSAISLGIWTTWVFPRLRLGNHPRFHGNIFKPTTYSLDGIPKT